MNTMSESRSGRFPRRLLLVCVAAVAFAGTFFGVSTVLDGVRFARAQAQVEQARAQLATVPDLGAVFKMVGRAVEPSVVNITVTRTRSNLPGRGPLGPMDEELLRRFFPDRDGDGKPDLPEQIERGNGSGVIMDVEDGYGFILTNNHVAGDATELLVTLNDGREIREAKVLGSDPKSDLAVVRIKADRLIPAKWGDSDQLEKGEIVLAFGSPFGFVGSMTQGIVSALNRQAGIIGGEFAYEDFVQVDAAINPGNSGGPLVNQRGEVVGINTAIASRSGGFQGIGFSIPSNQARPVYEQIRKRGRVIRGWLGVEIMDVRRLPEEQLKSLKFEGTDGVFVRTVQRGTPAFGTLQAGDIVTEFDGKPLRDTRQLRNMVAATAPGTEVSMRVIRDGESRVVKVKIGEQPDDPARVASASEPGDAAASAEKLGLRLSTPNARQLEAVGLDANSGGALVRSVTPGSLAAEAGIEPGDIITSIGGKRIADANDAAEALSGADITKGVRLTVSSREGDRMIFLQRR